MSDIRSDRRLQVRIADAIRREIRANPEVLLRTDDLDQISAEILARVAIETYRKEVPAHAE